MKRTKKTKSQLNYERCERRRKRVDAEMLRVMKLPATTRGPVIVNYGVGVDSTAVLIEMHRLGIVPDAIIFADTGGEKPETLAYLQYIRPWLRSVGFPDVKVLKRFEHCKHGRSRTTGKLTTYETLQEECDQKHMLPSLAFGGHSCSIKWKADAINAYLKTQAWFTNAQALAHCMEDPSRLPIHIIGFDNSTADVRRRHNADEQNAKSCNEHCCQRWFPLQCWGWAREECVRQIMLSGLDVPAKSACFFCPGSKKWELAWLAASNPELLLQSIDMEDAWIAGPHGPMARMAEGKPTSTKGLGRNWNWRAYCQDVGILVGDRVDRARARELLAEEMPWTAGTVQLTMRGEQIHPAA